MLIDSYLFTEEDEKKGGIHFVLVPKGINPFSLDIFKNKKVTFSNLGSDVLNETDKRTALNSKKALDDLKSQGYYLGSALIKVEEEFGTN